VDTQSLSIADGASFGDAHVADIDGDGFRDIVVSGETGGLATIFWRCGRGNRSFASTRTFTSGESGLYDEFDLADLAGDGDLDIACRETGASGARVVVIAFDPASGGFGQTVTVLPGGIAEFIHGDFDATWDVSLSQVDWGLNGAVYRGRPGYAFDLVQDLPGVVTSASSYFFGSRRQDLVSGGRGEVAVWKNLIGAADVDQGVADRDQRGCDEVCAFRPSIASSGTTVMIPAWWRGPFRVEAVEASGRLVARRSVVGHAWAWDLRSDRGCLLPSGPCWIRISDMDGRSATGRLQVLR
jgi:hypothetical protein